MDNKPMLVLAAFAVLLVASLGIYFFVLNAEDGPGTHKSSKTGENGQILSYFANENPASAGGAEGGLEPYTEPQPEPPAELLPPSGGSNPETSTEGAQAGQDACAEIGLSPSECLDDGESLLLFAIDDEEIPMDDISFSVSGDADEGDEKIQRKDLVLKNVSEATLRNVHFTGSGGEIILGELPFDSVYGEKNIAPAFKIEKNSLGVDSSKYPELDQPAHLKFTGIGGLKDAYPMRNGVPCGTYCTNFAYDSRTGRASMDVSGFSNYSIGGINISRAEHLDSSYAFISDITPQVKEKDGTWSEQIPAGDFVRATFEENLSNGKVIDVYVRKGGASNVYFEIYQNGTASPLLGTSGPLTDSGEWSYISVQNLAGEADTFDFQVLGDSGGYVEFDYIHDVPGISSINLTSTYGTNTSSENLTVRYNYTVDTPAVKNITTWYLNSSSLMVLQMPFEGGSTTTFTKNYGTGSNGTGVNGIAWSATGGHDGWGKYYCDGSNDYMTTSTVPPASAGTLNVWFRDPVAGQTAGYYGVIAGATSVPRLGLGIYDTNESLWWGFDATTVLWTSKVNLNDNTWHMATITWGDGSGRAKIYFDGAYLANTTDDGVHTFISLNICQWNAVGSSRYFRGDVDDMAIYNRALSPQQVLALYQKNTDVMLSQEIKMGETWMACVTPNNATADLTRQCSNSLLVRGAICTCTTCATCTTALNNVSCAEVRLTADISGSASTCINDPANFTNKTFDCQGHLIDGDDGSGDYGIYLDGTGNSNNIIKNCRITDFQYGIFFYTSANNNQAINNTIISCSSYGIYQVSSSYHNLRNNIIYNNQYGVYLSSSNFNLIINNSIYSNSIYGIRLSSSSSNNLTNNSVYNNTQSGIRVAGSNNDMTNNTVYGNRQNGFELVSACANNILSGNRAYNNTWSGINISGCTGNTPMSKNTIYGNGWNGIYSYNANVENSADNHVYNNTGGEVGLSATSTYTVSFTNLTLDNPYGNFTNYTSMDISDVHEANSAYNIKWTRSSSSPPSGYGSFRQKFVNISVVSGSPNITSITFNWLTGELSGYNESKFHLYKWNGTWTDLNSSPDTGNNRLTIYNVASFSDFGILEEQGGATPVSACIEINESGSYSQAANLSGAPIDASEIVFGASACVKIGAPNVTFDCAGYNITNNGTTGSTYGILLNSSSESVTLKNCPSISKYSAGINVDSSPYNVISNVTVHNNTGGGIYLSAGSDSNNLTGNTARDNGFNGFYLDQLSGTYAYNNTAEGNGGHGFFLNEDTLPQNKLIGNTARNNSGDGFNLYSSNDGTLANNTAYLNGESGFHLDTSLRNNLTNNTAHSNSLNGISLSSSSNNNTLTSNHAYNNSYYGIRISSSSNNTLTSNTACNNTLYGFHSIRSNNTNFSLNTACNSTLYGFYIANSSGNNLASNTAYNNGDGFSLLSNINTKLTNNTAYNSGDGFYLLSNINATLTNNTARNNSGDGFYLYYSNDGTLANNTAYNCRYGFIIYLSNNTNLTGSTAGNNSEHGIFIERSNNTNATDTHLFNNTLGDLGTDNTGSTSRTVYFTNLTLDSPAGNFTNYTSLDIFDLMEGDSEYIIKWTANQYALPGTAASFRQKFMKITGDNPVSIGRITWHWTESELSGYDETRFGLWKYNSSAEWEVLNDTPDISNNTLTLYDVDRASEYGILRNTTLPPQNCPIINDEGDYAQPFNYTGAPNNASPFPGTACVIINVSNVNFDCAGYNITNNGTGGTTYGFLVIGPRTNITIENCPLVSNYSYGAYLNNTNNSNILNITTLNNTIYLSSSSNNTISNCGQGGNTSISLNGGSANTISGNLGEIISLYGSTRNLVSGNNFTSRIYLGSGSNYNNLTDNIALETNYSQSRIDISNSSSLIISGNTILNSKDNYGIYLTVSSNDTIANNTVYNTHYDGIFVDTVNSSTFRNNTVQNYSNGLGFNSGFYIRDSRNNTFEYNTARLGGALGINGFSLINSHLNTLRHNYAYKQQYGFVAIGYATYNNTLYNNTASNSTFAGFYISGEAENNTLENNTALNTTRYGFQLNDLARYNALRNNTAYSNNMGFALTESASNRLYDNTAYGNNYGIYLQDTVSDRIYSMTLYNNSISSLRFNNTGYTGISYQADSILFRDAEGSNYNYTNLTINDSSEAAEEYSINWSSNSSGLPADRVSFLNKFLNISTLNGAVSINNATWNWLTSELTDYNEFRFELWKYNSTGWSNAGATLNTGANTLTLANLNPESEYGILQNNMTNCPIVDTSGTFTMLSDYSGAPNDASPLPGSACVIISVSNVAFDCDGHTITDDGLLPDTYGILVNTSLSNITIKNCPGISKYNVGIYAHESNNSFFINNSAYNDTLGFKLYSSSNNTLVNNTAFNNSHGVYLDSSSNNIIANNTAFNNSQDGIYLNSGSSNIIANNTAYRNNMSGIGLNRSGYNNITNNSAYDNRDGFDLYASSNNTFFNNSADESEYYGFDIHTNSTNNTFAGNTAHGSGTHGFGFFFSSSNNTLTNNTASGSSWQGFYLECPDNALINNTAYGNKWYGFWIYNSSNITLINNTAFNNNKSGFYVENMTGSTLYGNTAYGNRQYGLYLVRSNNTNATNTHLYNNSYDLYVSTDSEVKYIYLYNLTFDNPTGNFTNYTSLNITDTINANTAYSINWTRNSTSLPAGTISFAQKFINISTIAGNASIDTISWNWDDSELTGYNKSKFELWKYNSTGWNMLNDTPDTSGNTLTLYDMNPASEYGILQNNALPNCPVISSPGTYVQPNNYTGAPNSAAPLPGSACVLITASNVVFDCNGYNISDTGGPSVAYGILLSSFVTNVTVKNCPGITRYDYGIEIYRSSNNTLINNTASDNGEGIYLEFASNNNTLINNTAYSNDNYGIYLHSANNTAIINNTARGNDYGISLSFSNNNTIINNTASFNTQYGIYLTSSSNNNILTNNSAHDNTNGIYIYASNNTLINNTAYDNTGSGIYLYLYASNNALTNNSAHDNTNGIYLETYTSNNTLTNNTAYGNSRSGIYLVSSSNNTLTNNSAYNNSRYGFYLTSSSNNNLTNNRAYNNGGTSAYAGIYLFSSSNNNLTSNSAYNNSRYGIYINRSNYTTLINNIAYSNDYDGISIYVSSNNTLTNNTAYNTQSGISLSSSSNNNLTGNNAYNNSLGIYLYASTGNNLTGNNAYNNTAHGILLSTSSNSNNLTGNNAYNNSEQGIYLYSSSNNTLASNSAYNNTWYGIYLQTSTNNTLIGNSAQNNSVHGFYMASSSYYNSLANNTASGNTQNGIYLSSSGFSNIINNSAYNNSQNGIYANNAGSSNFTGNDVFGNGQNGIYIYNGGVFNVGGNTAYNNTLSGIYLQFILSANTFNNTVYGNAEYGLQLRTFNKTNSTNDHLYNNGLGEVYFNASSARSYNFTNLSIDNPAGNFENYTRLDIYGQLRVPAYIIKWSSNSSALPAEHVSFAQKFIDISNITSGVSIDTITWRWDDSELSGYNETKFELWKYNASAGWTMLNNSPDTSNNSLTLTNMDPASDYGILQNDETENCPLINSPGTYAQAMNYTGAPNNASEVESDAYACVKINSSDVEFDCGGFSITGNDTLGTTQYGFFLYGTITNVTLKNCIVSSYDTGIYSYYSSNGLFENNTVSDSSENGLILYFSDYNNLTNNNAYNNSVGIYLYTSTGNNLTGNNAYNNTANGIILSSSSNSNTLTNNNAYNNTANGIILFSSSNYNTLTGNNAYNNTANGISLSTSSNSNNLTSNNAYNNSQRGISLSSSTGNNLINNNAYNNTQHGIYLSTSSNNNLANNNAFNNSQYGIYLVSSSSNNLTNNTANTNGGTGIYAGIYLFSNSNSNNLTNNSAYNNSRYGIYLSSSSNNNLINNSAYDNPLHGIYLSSSSGNNLTGNNAYNNTANGILLFSNSNSNTLINNNAYNNTQYGFYLLSSSNNNITSNSAYNNGGTSTYAGIYLSSSSYNALTNNSAYNNSRSGILLSSSSNNNLTNNSAYNNTGSGIDLSGSNSNTLTNNSAYNNTQSGFYIASSNNNTLTNNNAYNNTQHGISLTFSSSNNTLTNNTAYSNDNYGISLASNSYNTLASNSAYNNTGSGIYLSSSNNNALSSNTVYNNGGTGVYAGISLSSSSYNNLTSNIAYNNSQYGIYLETSSNNTLTNNSAHDKYYGISLSSSSNNTLTNNNAYKNSIYGISLSSSNSNALANNSAYNNTGIGIYLVYSSNNTLANNSAYNNTQSGFYLTSSNNNNLTNNRAYNNSWEGTSLSFSSNNTLTNNSAYNNSWHGIYLWSSSNNTLTNNSAYNNSLYGIYIYLSNNTLVSNQLAYNNAVYGISINDSNSTSISGAHLYNNGRDFWMQTSTAPYEVNLTNAIFDNPYGNLENYTNLSLFDIAAASSTYSINWTTNSTSLPADTFSFAQKFINISTQVGTASIDTISWNWDDSELSGYNETNFELWKYNSSGWNMLNGTPDTENNTLSLTDMDPASDYGILQNNETIVNCPIISSPGTYAQAANYTGAPNDASDVSFDSYACLRINSSDVEFDCSGFSITGNDSLGTLQYGVLVYGPFTNVTLKNCMISSYDMGFFSYQLENSSFENNSAYNSSQYGIYLYSSGSNTLTNNTAYEGPQYGFYIYNSNHLNLTDNNAYNNAQDGFTFSLFSNNTLTNNTAYDNAQHGFYLESSTDNTLASNSAYNNTQHGFYLTSSSDSNTFTNNNAYNNTLYGFYLEDSDYNNLTSNYAYNNSNTGIYLYLSTDNNLTSNHAYNNTGSGIYLNSNSNFNTLTSNSAYNNSQYGIYLGSSTGNTLANNTANTNLQYGIYLFSSNNNNLTDNTANTNLQYGISLSSSSSNNLINNFASGNSMRGIFLGASSSNNLINNTAISSPQFGILLQMFSSSNNLINNSAYNNSQSGILLQSNCNFNTLTNNNASSNGVSGIYLQGSTSNNLSSNTASFNNQSGIYLQATPPTSFNNNTLTNNTANSNLLYGFYLLTSSNNTLTNNSAQNNSRHGFYMISGSHNNTLISNTVSNNNWTGIHIQLSNNTRISNPLVYNNAIYGISINNSNSTRISGAHFHNNSLDFRMQTPAAPYEVNLTNAIFDNPYGNLENYTNLSLFDIAAASSTYSINWTTNSTSLPADTMSFAQKFINISTIAGNASIDTISWNWDDSELSGYNETRFELWKYNSSGWEMLNDTPDTENNTLSLTNMNPASEYGILENNATDNCPVITTGGAYLQTSDYTGAPNPVSGITGITNACVVILASDVEFDCDGYTVIGDGTASTAGIFANTSATNITVKNCQVSNYAHGLTVKNTNGGVFTNITSHNNTVGFNVNNAQYLSLAVNRAENNTNGFVLESGSSYNNITGSIAHNNALYGFYLYQSANYNRLAEDFSYNNSYGFLIESSNYNNLTGSFAHNNSQDGFMGNNSYDLYLDPSGFHDNNANGVNLNNCNGVNLTDISASNNEGNGIKMNQATTVTLVNVNVSDNKGHGLHMVNTDGISISQSTFCFNHQYGIMLQGGANTWVSASDICENTQNGAYMVDSSDSTFSDNNVYGNGESGTFVDNSGPTYLLREHFYNNGYDLEVNEDDGDPVAFNATNAIFDRPAGDYQYFTNLSINDTFDSYAYTINWTTNSSSLPAGTVSFRQKFVNITTQAGAPSIDRVIWHWNTGELPGYTESRLELWKYTSSGGWGTGPINDTPDTSVHTLSQYGLNPSSHYAILENQENVTNITVYLNSPPDLYITMDTSVTFNCSAATAAWKSLANITLYGNWSGGWSANETKALSGASDSETFTKTFAPGTYAWNCLGFDNTAESDWGNSNFTFTVTNATYELIMANVTVLNTSKYEGNATVGQYELLGGNLTEANANLMISTEKWAGMYGNFSATFVLAENASANFMYEWELNASAGGEICLTQNQSPTWGLLSTAVKSQIDSAWGFEATDSDSANNTLTDNSALIYVAGATTPTTGTYLDASSNFQTGAFKITGAPVNETDFAFCVNLSGTGTNYQSKPVNFEMIVPTSEGYGWGPLETYYVFVELG